MGDWTEAEPGQPGGVYMPGPTLTLTELLNVALTGGVLACGGDGGSVGGGGGGAGNSGTMPGICTITLTGLSGTTTETGTVILTAQ